MSLFYGLNIPPSRDEEMHRLTCERDRATDMLQRTIEALKRIESLPQGRVQAKIARTALEEIGYINAPEPSESTQDDS